MKQHKLCKKEKEKKKSVRRPGGPYPRSLHGHCTDMKGKNLKPMQMWSPEPALIGAAAYN